MSPKADALNMYVNALKKYENPKKRGLPALALASE